MSLAQEISNRIRAKLMAEGFQPGTPGILTTPIVDDILGWVGLNVTSKQKVVTVNIVVGLRSEGIELFICRLVGEPIFGKCAPTIATHLGYLLPGNEYQPWIFDREIGGEEIDVITSSIREFGVPFMKDNASLALLAQRLHDPKLAARHQAMFRLPACYVLLGERDRALALCDQYVEEVRGRHDALAEYFRRFAAELPRAKFE